MSKKDKFANVSAGLGEALDKLVAKPAADVSPRTAPGQLMAFRNEMVAYEEKIAALEERVRDLETEAIPVAAIAPNPWQPRRVFEQGKLQELAGSIAESGLIQPIIVRSVQRLDSAVGTASVRISDTSSVGEGVRISDTRYQIIVGERRWRAHRLLGKESIKAIVVMATDEEMASLALAENFDREDLVDYEIAVAIRNADAAFPNRKSLAACLGINRTALYQYLSFFKLPDFVVADLEVSPALIGRTAAEDVASVLKRYGDKAIESLRQTWPRMKTGDIDQGKLANMLEAAVLRSDHAPRAEREIRKLFVGKEQAGSITRDAAGMTIRLRAEGLTPEKEKAIREFVETTITG